MPGIKELKTRINSIGSTRKITRAMQMVSAAKMRKSQTAVLQSRTYASLAWDLVSQLSAVLPQTFGSTDQDLMEKNKLFNLLQTYSDAKKVGVIIISSNRGLVGSLNTNLLSQLITLESPELLTEIITYGKKAHLITARMNKNIVADFQKLDKTASVEDIYPIAKFITQAYATGKYNKIIILYNHFISTLVQKVTVKRLLPFTSDLTTSNLPLATSSGYLFEPAPEAVINHLIPRIIESQLYQSILESNASEESARMVMMKNATEAAGDLIADYTLTYNQLRQGKITTELSEITAGRIALE